MIRHLSILIVLALLLGACSVNPMTPPPSPSATLPPVRVVVITATQLPLTATARPTSTLVPTLAPFVAPVVEDALADADAPADVEAPAVEAAQALAAPPTQAAVLVAGSGGAAELPPVPTVAPPPVPTAVPVPVLAPPQSSDAAAAEQYTIDLINTQRANNGLAPLARDETLMGVARGRVADMVARNYRGHNDPVTGVSLGRGMIRAAGFTSNYIGENWYGTVNGPPMIAEIAMNWFMTDPPHYRNILNPNYSFVGVGIAYNGRQWLLVQSFAGGG